MFEIQCGKKKNRMTAYVWAISGYDDRCDFGGYSDEGYIFRNQYKNSLKSRLSHHC